jgi:hypothetical protein
MAKGGAKEVCTVPGCGRDRVAWGLCGTHDYRVKTHGHVGPSPRSQSRAETTAADGTRQCFKCGERKLFTAEFFPEDARRPPALKGTCRTCLRAAVRNSSRIALYGIGSAQFDQIMAAQGGACALCGMQLDGESKKTTAHVDHCHSTGKVRGILCHQCNVLLGNARESPALLAAAITYLEAHNAVTPVIAG